MKWYAHGPYSSDGMILEELERTANERFMAEEAMPKLARELYNYFYEVEFDVEVNELTGEIQKITISPKNEIKHLERQKHHKR